MSSINYSRVMKFGEIPDGAHFQELRKNPRKFIKIKSSYASGVPFKVYTIGLGENDEPQIPNWDHYVNALDYNGTFGKCPDWLEFEVIDKP